METEKLIEEIKNETGNSEDIIIKKVFVENKINIIPKIISKPLNF